MQTKEAVDLLNALVKAGKVQQIVNAMLNGTCARASDNDMFRDVKIREIVDAVAKTDDFKGLSAGVAGGARAAYRLHGIPFEAIVCALFTGGFIAGAQFALDGGKAEHVHDHNTEKPTKPPTLVN